MDEIRTYHVTAKWEAGRNGIVSAKGRSIHPSTSRLLRNSKERPVSGRQSIFYWLPSRRVSSRPYAIAAASKLEFVSLQLCVEGRLGKSEGKLQFTEIVLQPSGS